MEVILKIEGKVFFVACAEFEVIVLALNGVSVVNVLGRGFPATC